MRWDYANHVEQIVWDMRLADLPRAENRAILNRLYNGDAPFDENTAAENNIEINRNDLTGVNLLGQARRQWIQAMLGPGNYDNITLDRGPKRKRKEWSHSITKRYNQVLKRSRHYKEQSRSTGGQLMLHGIAPVSWKTRRSVVPRSIPISSLLIPSETYLDFDNLTRFAIFQEWTPAQLWKLTHGPKVDRGWNMPMVRSQWKYVRDQVQKEPNATAFQYMPERIEELEKQDLGFWGSDAVPTIDVWDFYARADDETDGWIRRIILDWGVEVTTNQKSPPKRHWDENKIKGFLYTSQEKLYSPDIEQLLHCQFGDLSAVFPQEYHSIRSFGWLNWGVCDLENRLHCKFSEAVFEQLMWFFRTASNAQLVRLKKGDFFHFGVIPEGIEWVKPQDRFTPDYNLLTMGFNRYQQLMSQNAAAYTQDFAREESGKEETATKTMARVNASNALISGMMTLAYDQEEFKDREVLRRLCIKDNPDELAQKFIRGIIDDGVDPTVLDPDAMDVTRERAMGGGNKTLEMAQVKLLQDIRKNLTPDAQRRVDHITVESATDDAALAEDLAPVEQEKPISMSVHDAQQGTERLMLGLPFTPMPQMIPEDYVKTWITDLDLLVKAADAAGGMATMQQIKGYQNIAIHVGKFLKMMQEDPDEKERIAEYARKLAASMRIVKGFAQRLVQQMKAQAAQGAAGEGGKEAAAAAAKIRSSEIVAQAKAKNLRESHAQKTAQKQVSFEIKEQQQERGHRATMRRLAQEADLKFLTEMASHQAGQNGDEE